MVLHSLDFIKNRLKKLLKYPITGGGGIFLKFLKLQKKVQFR